MPVNRRPCGILSHRRKKTSPKSRHHEGYLIIAGAARFDMHQGHGTIAGMSNDDERNCNTLESLFAKGGAGVRQSVAGAAKCPIRAPGCESRPTPSIGERFCMLRIHSRRAYRVLRICGSRDGTLPRLPVTRRGAWTGAGRSNGVQANVAPPGVRRVMLPSDFNQAIRPINASPPRIRKSGMAP